VSWESLEAITDHDNEVRQASEIATMYFSCFGTDAGQRVLEDLVNKFLTKPVVRSGEDAFAQGIREGRCDLIRQILIQIEYAKNPQSTESGVFVYLKKLLRK
jgi:hypothetical protein